MGAPATPALAGTLARCAGLGVEHLRLDVRLGRPRGRGWVVRDDLLAPGPRDDLLARVGRTARSARPRVQGTWLLEWYAGALVAPAVAAALTEGRVPDVGAANVAVLVGADGAPAATSLARPRFAALPGDPGAADRHAVRVGDRAALWAWYAERLVEHLEPVVAALAPVTRRGRRALWASVEDVCSGYLHRLGEALGRQPLARADADRLLGVQPPLSGRAVFVEVPHPDGARTLLRRNGCCLSYAREDPSAVACSTCPRLGGRAGAPGRRDRERVSAGR